MAQTNQDIIANEARKQAARIKVAQLEGQVNATSDFAAQASQFNSSASGQLSQARADLAQLEAGIGPGVTDSYGEYSSTDQALRIERFAGKAASVDFVKANPESTEEQAVEVYRTAALAARPADRQWLLQDPNTLRKEYTANLVKYGLIPDDTWESWRAWVLATPRDIILGLN